MTLNGKGNDFTIEDFRACAKTAFMKRGRAQAILEEVRTAVARWPEFGAEAKVGEIWLDQIGRNHRL